MVSLKIQKRSVLVLILTLILFSGNTIIIGYLTPLLYLVGFFSFIWGDRKQIRSNKYTDGSLKTVDSNTAIERLENLCGYVFAEKQKVQLKRLRETRNRFEHGAIDNNPRAVESAINNAVEVIVDFLGKN